MRVTQRVVALLEKFISKNIKGKNFYNFELALPDVKLSE